MPAAQLAAASPFFRPALQSTSQSALQLTPQKQKETQAERGMFNDVTTVNSNVGIESMHLALATGQRAPKAIIAAIKPSVCKCWSDTVNVADSIAGQI